MTPSEAARLAASAYGATLDRYGLPLIDHARRVAATVPEKAAAAAWLHEVFEFTTLTEEELRCAGMIELEITATRLLTRDSLDPSGYAEHIERIAEAPGPAGDLARLVKIADLRDRLNHHAGARSATPRPPHEVALARLERRGPMVDPARGHPNCKLTRRAGVLPGSWTEVPAAELRRQADRR